MFDGLRDLIRPSYRKLRRFFSQRDWRQRAYASPSPKRVKDAVLLRQGVANAIWVETGTFLGETTALLARHATHVYSLEPAQKLYERAAKKFGSNPRVTIIGQPSEQVFPELLPKLTGPVNFWLDGHYSAGPTFKGAIDTPIREELAAIAANLKKLSPVVVLVDDIRAFNPSVPGSESYPALDELVDWARANDLKWEIEHDIFVARTR